MAAEPSIEEIMAAIDESGYLVEQEVATQLEKLDFHVWTNYPYEDSDEGKSREIDVRAIKRVAYNEQERLAAYVELIVECKNSSNPFVFIARPKNEADKRRSPEGLTFPYDYEMRQDLGGGRAQTREISAFTHLGFDRVHTDHLAAWKAVQFCRIDRKGGGWHANHGGLYDALFYPMAKAIKAQQAEMPKRATRPDEWRYFWFLVPLVVTTGGLMLMDSTEEPPVPRPVDRVSFSRELKSGKLKGNFTLTFVRQEALEQYVREAIDPIASLARSLIEERVDFLRQTSLPWHD